MRFPSSLRARLLISTCCVALLALLVADVSVYASLRSFLYGQIDTNLEASHLAIEQALAGPPNRPGGPGSHLPIPPGQPNGAEGGFCGLAGERAPGMFVQVRTAANTVVKSENCPGFGAGGTALAPELPSRLTGLTASSSSSPAPLAYFDAPSATKGGANFRVGASELPNGLELIVALPAASVDETLRQLLLVEILVSAAALGAAFLLGWWLVFVDLRPLRAVERTASAMGEGDFSDRVRGIDPHSEVGRVANAINVMADGIERAFQERDRTEAELRDSESRLRQFVADASHELRTPIAAISAYAQLVERGAVRNEADLDRAISGIEQSSARMARLVEDLLYLARLDEQALHDDESVEIVGIAAEAIDTARTVGPDWTVTLEATGPVFVHGNPAALRQVLDNLLLNVRAHTPVGTHASVRVAFEEGEAIIEVGDDGPGFSPGDAERLFERFYRTDASRSRATGGAGLGLSIVQSIVTKHGGSVSARTGVTGGASFRVSLPALDPDEVEGP